MPDIANLAPEVALLVILLWYFERKDKRQEHRDELMSKAFVQLAKSIDDNTAQGKKIEKVVKSNDTYLRERNGRDNEMHTKVIENLQILKGFLKRAST